jgi:hypothetical protein
MDAALWGFLGTLVGAAASFLATYLSAKYAAKSQGEAAARERAIREQLLQRETLIELQNELNNLLRANAVIFMDDMRQAQQGMPWSQLVANVEAGEAARRAFAQVSVLTSRVTIDTVRSEVGKVRDLLNIALDASDHVEADRRHRAAMLAGIEVIEKVGAEIRSCGVAV